MRDSLSNDVATARGQQYAPCTRGQLADEATAGHKDGRALSS